MSAWGSKAHFMECGLTPLLQHQNSNDNDNDNDNDNEPESCTICLKDLAFEAPPSSPFAPLSEAEKNFLDAVIIGTKKPLDILSFRENAPRRSKDVAGKEPEHASVRIKACRHVFGLGCLEEWLQEKNSCPMCRKTLFARGSGRPGEWANV
ncbi:hypothetical protein P3342_002220 [Pyrenophora teres f. teres]|uniref:Zf-RING 2 multi-domain protein n=1 Tax=Pyrenophora teres f. teres TaxID=97479 RepID=A0A6S6W4N5_9PLEO|nr:hypothetical protein PTNB85_02774 [Pyrenophora teres f. teres]KAE8847295.1 hypothetical protein HRS9122_04202 [Pyrenophora teres f. teres]KAE8866345.1 hypothetical protein PTNB29_03492 [Pyrenophora teres f. teres]KAE8871982.1 hypothetical protein PTNB73_03441 [Pyrenophora teres f. teres]KAK1919926.1 hypothetical protein P3342_002220 [Pyrenophora teres f. teres]